MLTPKVIFEEKCSKSISEEADLPQSIPCKLDYTGPAPVSEFFNADTVAENIFAATFRGRLLKGHCVQLPEDYHLYAAREKKQMYQGKWQRKYNVTLNYCRNNKQAFWNMELNSDFLVRLVCESPNCIASPPSDFQRILGDPKTFQVVSTSDSLIVWDLHTTIKQDEPEPSIIQRSINFLKVAHDFAS